MAKPTNKSKSRCEWESGWKWSCDGNSDGVGDGDWRVWPTAAAAMSNELKA